MAARPARKPPQIIIMHELKEAKPRRLDALTYFDFNDSS